MNPEYHTYRLVQKAGKFGVILFFVVVVGLGFALTEVGELLGVHYLELNFLTGFLLFGSLVLFGYSCLWMRLVAEKWFEYVYAIIGALPFFVIADLLSPLSRVY